MQYAALVFRMSTVGCTAALAVAQPCTKCVSADRKCSRHLMRALIRAALSQTCYGVPPDASLAWCCDVCRLLPAADAQHEEEVPSAVEGPSAASRTASRPATVPSLSTGSSAPVALPSAPLPPLSRRFSDDVAAAVPQALCVSDEPLGVNDGRLAAQAGGYPAPKGPRHGTHALPATVRLPVRSDT